MKKQTEQVPEHLKERTLDRGQTIFVHRHHRNASTIAVSAYVFEQENGAPDAIWLNLYLKRFVGWRLDRDEYVLVPDQGGQNIEDHVAEELGRAVWGDERAFIGKRLP